jgi:hypothetical protein
LAINISEELKYKPNPRLNISKHLFRLIQFEILRIRLIKCFLAMKKQLLTHSLLLMLFAFFGFSTFAQTESCGPITLELYDSYGDGWNGNDMDVISNSGTTIPYSFLGKLVVLGHRNVVTRSRTLLVIIFTSRLQVLQ